MLALLLAIASITASPPPLLQAWSDTGLIAVDDDWSRVPAIVGYRGDGLVTEPGGDPRVVVADGSSTPVDVNADEKDPRAVALAAGVTEFELPDPVVAIQGSATASAPHLVISLDTRGRSNVSVRMSLRDIDATAANAVSPVSVQYRVGASGNFAPVPGGYVADATSGPSSATLVTPVHTTLPADANDEPLVQIRVITTNAAGQDEWIGVDDIEVEAATAPGTCEPAPPPAGPQPVPAPPATGPVRPALTLTGLALTPDTFLPTQKGAAIVRRRGSRLRFRLSRPAVVRFDVTPVRTADLTPKDAVAKRRPPVTGGRFTARGRRGLNRLRFSGRLRGKPLAGGSYILRAVATDRSGTTTPPAFVRFHIRDESD